MVIPEVVLENLDLTEGVMLDYQPVLIEEITSVLGTDEKNNSKEVNVKLRTMRQYS
jgi:hypothetical protein